MQCVEQSPRRLFRGLGIIYLVAMFTICIASAGVAEEPPAKTVQPAPDLINATGNVQYAQSIRIDSDPTYLKLPPSKIIELGSSAVARDAVVKIAGNQDVRDMGGNYYQDPGTGIEYSVCLSGDEQSWYNLRVVVVDLNGKHDDHALKAAGRKFVEAFRDSLTKSLNERADREFRNRMEREQGVRTIQSQMHRELESVAAKLREELEKLGGTGKSPTMLADNLEALHKQLQTLQVEREGGRARLEHIEDVTKRASISARDRTEADPVVQKLKKVIELRSQHVDRVMKLFGAGQASDDEVNKARTELAAAEVELARAQTDSLRGAGGDLLEKLQAERTQLSIGLVEMEVKSQVVEKQLRQTQDQLQRELMEIEPRRQQLAVIKQRIEALDSALQTAEMEQVRLQATYHGVRIETLLPDEPAAKK